MTFASHAEPVSALKTLKQVQGDDTTPLLNLPAKARQLRFFPVCLQVKEEYRLSCSSSLQLHPFQSALSLHPLFLGNWLD